ncbi:MAG: response regulator transcription factor [Chloroflexi bacterium]|nr:response regulator transcription factor [Chloroflexota bacterium]
MKSVLIIEDEARIAHWVAQYFERAGFAVWLAADGLTGLTLARQHHPALIILDLMLPGMDGVEVCRTLRLESDVPIIMLTARGEEDERVDGLTAGADDYVVKPFSSRELVARGEAVLRRVQQRVQQRLQAGGIALDTNAFRCTVDGREIHLSRAQFAILEMLMRHPGQVITRQQLMDAAYAEPTANFDRAIDTHIRRLRRQIEPEADEPRYIQTVYGVGYKFIAEPPDAPPTAAPTESAST